MNNNHTWNNYTQETTTENHPRSNFELKIVRMIHVLQIIFELSKKAKLDVVYFIFCNNLIARNTSISVRILK